MLNFIYFTFIIIPRGGLEGRFNLIIAENGVALDSGRFSRKDRHAAPPPDRTRLAELQIECDINYQTKAEVKARKAWEDYKKLHNLCDQKIRDGLQVGVDYKMLCFSALTNPCKNKKQLEAETMKQTRGLGIVENGSVTFGYVPDPESMDEDESEDEDEV